jgi:hypothetical protein
MIGSAMDYTVDLGYNVPVKTEFLCTIAIFHEGHFENFPFVLVGSTMKFYFLCEFTLNYDKY